MDIQLIDGKILVVLRPNEEATLQIDIKRQVETGPTVVRMIDQLPTNPNPTNPKAWYIRTVNEIRGVTIHHTGANSVEATAAYHISKGRPSIEYHFMIGFDGTVHECAPLTWGMWHDHTGHKNVNISVGMFGYHHQEPPPDPQLLVTAQFAVFLTKQFGLLKSDIKGHNDYWRTTCPGWGAGGWRGKFYAIVEATP